MCGDGFVDAALHEQCDGSTNEQCLDYGFDMGTTSCSADCQVDVTDGCIRFGWQLAMDAYATKLWTDGTTFAYLTGSIGLHVESPNGNFTDDTNPYIAIAGGGGIVAAIQGTMSFEATIVEIVNGAEITIPQPPYGLSTVPQLAVDDAGDIYTIDTGDACTIQIYDGMQWTLVSTPSIDDCTALTVSSGPTPRVFEAYNGDIYEAIAGSLQLQTTIPGHFVSSMLYADGVLWIGGGGLYEWNGTGAATTAFTGAVVESLAVVGSIVYGTTTTPGTLVRWNGLRPEYLPAPTGGTIAGAGGQLYAAGGPIYRYTGIEFGLMAAVPPASFPGGPLVDVARLGSGDAIAMRGNVLFRGTFAGWEPHTPMGGMQALAVTGDVDIVVETYDGIPTNALDIGLSRGSSLDTFTPLALPDPVQASLGISLATDHTLYAVGAFGFGVYTSQWTVVAPADPTCTPHAVYAIDASSAVAAGDCAGTGIVWQEVGGVWSELWRASTGMPFTGVTATADGWIFAAGTGGSAWFDTQAWHADPTVIGRSLSGLSNDMWLASGFASVQHWDGTRWSEVTSDPIDNMAVSAYGDEVLFAGGADGHVLLLRDP